MKKKVVEKDVLVDFSELKKPFKSHKLLDFIGRNGYKMALAFTNFKIDSGSDFSFAGGFVPWYSSIQLPENPRFRVVHAFFRMTSAPGGYSFSSKDVISSTVFGTPEYKNRIVVLKLCDYNTCVYVHSSDYSEFTEGVPKLTPEEFEEMLKEVNEWQDIGSN